MLSRKQRRQIKLLAKLKHGLIHMVIPEWIDEEAITSLENIGRRPRAIHRLIKSREEGARTNDGVELNDRGTAVSSGRERA